MRNVLLLPLAILAACQPVGQPDAPPSAPVPIETDAPQSAVPGESGDAIASAERLIDEYRVAGADGRGIDLPYGISASISADRIDVSADCVVLAWSYRFESGRLITQRLPAKSCKRALTPEEQTIAAAFDSATSVAVTASNAYEFSGGGHSVTLFTQ